MFRISGVAPDQRVVQSPDAERGVHGVGQPPGEDVPGRPVHHGHQVEKPLRHRDIGDVRAPYMVRPGDREAAKEIGKDPVLRTRHARARPPVGRLHPHDCHEPPDPVSARGDALAAQMPHQLPASVERIRHVQLVHAPHERQVLGALPLRPVVLRRPAHAQQPALPRKTQRSVPIIRPRSARLSA